MNHIKIAGFEITIIVIVCNGYIGREPINLEKQVRRNDIKKSEISKVQEKSEYYELGDSISKAQILEELAGINLLQAEIDRLTTVVTGTICFIK